MPLAQMPKAGYAGAMPLFSSANAREMGRLGGLAKRGRRHASQGSMPDTTPLATPLNPAVDAFMSARLARVRAQLDRLDALISEQLDAGKELDPQAIDRLAAASSKFEEQERRLSNRSLPPTKRGAETPKGSKLGYLLDQM